MVKTNNFEDIFNGRSGITESIGDVEVGVTGPGAGPGGPGGFSVGDGETAMAHTPLKTPRISSSPGQVYVFLLLQHQKEQIESRYWEGQR